jgi:tryptophan 7-halogenase
MKKFLVLGSGTAGLIAATMIKRRWGDKVQVSLYYDSKQKNIGVGESTTPSISYFLKAFLKVDTFDFLQKTKSTLKLGINFKNWIKGTEFFHGFQELNNFEDSNYPESLYSMISNEYDGGKNFSEPSTTLPSHVLHFLYALHIDTQILSEYIHEKIKDEIEIIDDIAEKVNSDGKNIQSIVFKNSGEITADFYIDASGFNRLLIKELNTEWNDISQYLPIDRAIAQQIPHEFTEIPTYTLSEATENGWIWQIPIKDRYGTGYLYSSKFTSDDEAKKKYNKWLLKNFNVKLNTDKIIKYYPGYYEKHWIGNCMSVGLSSGFIEPLESTGIHIIIMQLKDFIEYNPTLKNLEYNRNECNRRNSSLYKEIVEFVCLHYNTNRTDSEFWKYMTNNKIEWVKNFNQKCKEEFLEKSSIEKDKEFWHIDSYIQVAHGLKMFNSKSIVEFIHSLPNGEKVLEDCRLRYQEVKNAKVRDNMKIPHRSVLENLANIEISNIDIGDKFTFV